VGVKVLEPQVLQPHPDLPLKGEGDLSSLHSHVADIEAGHRDRQFQQIISPYSIS